MQEAEIKMQRMLIAVIMGIVIISGVIGISAAPPPNAQEKIVQHVTNDNAVRALQVFDISQVEKGSQITNTNAIFSLSSNVGDDCVLLLNEPHLNKDEISDPFVCAVENIIPLKIIGIHALQSKLNSENFNIEIKYITSGDILNIPSNDITLDISYLTPTYFALVENGIVVNVIVADQNFIDSLNGQWIETTGKRASIGDIYDGGTFAPIQPYPSWVLIDGTWTPPTPQPPGFYHWNEETLTWVNNIG